MLPGQGNMSHTAQYYMTVYTVHTLYRNVGERDDQNCVFDDDDYDCDDDDGDGDSCGGGDGDGDDQSDDNVQKC